MGGSVAVHVAAKKAISSLAGLVVVDVVEVLVMHHLFQHLIAVLLLHENHIDNHKYFREQLWLR